MSFCERLHSPEALQSLLVTHPHTHPGAKSSHSKSEIILLEYSTTQAAVATEYTTEYCNNIIILSIEVDNTRLARRRSVCTRSSQIECGHVSVVSNLCGQQKSQKINGRIHSVNRKFYYSTVL